MTGQNFNNDSLINDRDDIWPASFIAGNEFLSFINNIPDAVIISNEAGQIIQVNDNAIS